MRKTIRTLAAMAVIATVIWAFYNPQAAQAKADEYIPAITAKLSAVSPWLILYYVKNIIKAIIGALITVIVLYIAYSQLTKAGVIPPIIPAIF